MQSKLAPTFGRLPTHLDLPDTDGKPMDNDFQLWQTMLLLDSIKPHLNRLHPDGQYQITGDMGIYYQITDPPLNGCKAPDWFYVPNVPRTAPDNTMRRSYVMWQELVRPAVVIEYVSDDKGKEYDRTPEIGKFWVYEQALAVPFYIIYDHREVKLQVYRMSGQEYELMQPDERGFYYIGPLRLNLGLHYDNFSGFTVNWLRWFDMNGEMLETNEEKLVEERAVSNRHRILSEHEKQRAEQEKQRAEQEKQRAEQEKQCAEQEKQRAEQEKQRAEQQKQRADQLAAQLRELGIEPK